MLSAALDLIAWHGGRYERSFWRIIRSTPPGRWRTRSRGPSDGASGLHAKGDMRNLHKGNL